EEHRTVPYFFSDLADWASLEYVGGAAEWDEEIVNGSPDEGRFSVWYLDRGRVRGVLDVNSHGDLDRGRSAIAAGESLTRAAILGADATRPGRARTCTPFASAARAGTTPTGAVASTRRAVRRRAGWSTTRPCSTPSRSTRPSTASPAATRSRAGSSRCPRDSSSPSRAAAT